MIERTVKESLFAVAHDIYAKERGIDHRETQGRWWQWPSDDHFPVKLRLDKVFVSTVRTNAYKILNASFELPDEEIAITIDRDQGEATDLDGDVFAIDILEKFETYYSHEHQLCIAALKARDHETTQAPAGTRLSWFREAAPEDSLAG